MVHVSEDGFCAVITRHNDIATVVSGIENVVVGIIRGLRSAFSRGFEGGLSRLDGFAFRKHVVLGSVERRLFADWFCRHHDGGTEHQDG